MKLIDSVDPTKTLFVCDQEFSANIRKKLQGKYFPSWEDFVSFVHVEESASSQTNFAARRAHLSDRLRLALGSAQALGRELPAIVFTISTLAWVKAVISELTNEGSVISICVPTKDAAIDVCVRYLPNSLKFRTIQERLNVVARRKGNFATWLRQWRELDLEWLGVAIARTIRIVDKDSIFDRILLTEQEISELGSPVYVILEEDGFDSNTFLGYLLRQYGSGDSCRVISVPNLPTLNFSSETVRAIQESSCIVGLDEVNFTGEKFYREQAPRLADISTQYKKPFLAKFAFATRESMPAMNRYFLEYCFDPGRFIGVRTNYDGNWLWDVCKDEPMAFDRALLGTRYEEALQESRAICAQLSKNSPFGFGEMAATALFEDVVPDNTLAALIKFGSVSRNSKKVAWKPLIYDRKRSN